MKQYAYICRIEITEKENFYIFKRKMKTTINILQSRLVQFFVLLFSYNGFVTGMF